MTKKQDESWGKFWLGVVILGIIYTVLQEVFGDSDVVDWISIIIFVGIVVIYSLKSKEKQKKRNQENNQKLVNHLQMLLSNTSKIRIGDVARLLALTKEQFMPVFHEFQKTSPNFYINGDYLVKMTPNPTPRTQHTPPPKNIPFESLQEQICTNCGFSNQAEVNFCSECGRALP